jgi:hypothetical protein
MNPLAGASDLIEPARAFRIPTHSSIRSTQAFCESAAANGCERAVDRAAVRAAHDSLTRLGEFDHRVLGELSLEQREITFEQSLE